MLQELCRLDHDLRLICETSKVIFDSASCLTSAQLGLSSVLALLRETRLAVLQKGAEDAMSRLSTLQKDFIREFYLKGLHMSIITARFLLSRMQKHFKTATLESLQIDVKDVKDVMSLLSTLPDNLTKGRLITSTERPNLDKLPLNGQKLSKDEVFKSMPGAIKPMKDRLFKAFQDREIQLAFFHRQARGQQEAVMGYTLGQPVPSSPSLSSKKDTRPGAGKTRAQSFDESLQNIPQPPRPRKPSEDKVACPYCTTLLDQDSRQGQNWVRHVLQDIRPYVCVIPGCTASLARFSSANSWMLHMTNNHQTYQWACEAEGHSEPLQFSSCEDFLAHMTAHDDSILDDQMAIAESGSRIVTTKLDAAALPSCPLCGISIKHFRGDVDLLCRHMAQELFDFALWSVSVYQKIAGLGEKVEKT